MIVSAARGITASSRFVGIRSFRPTSSATINASANKNPPLPWFQLRLNESGNTTSANIIGLEISKIAAIKLLFCIKYSDKID